MTAPHSIDPARFLAAQLADPGSDLLRAMSTAFVNALMSAEADALCGAEYGTVSEQRINTRNGHHRTRHETYSAQGGPDVSTRFTQAAPLRL